MEEYRGYDFICMISELKESEGKRFYINDVDIAVFKVGDEVFVVSNICPHQHAAKIYEGFIEDGCVVCPLHGWMFKLSDGKLHTGGRGLDTYPVKVSEGKIYSKIVEKKLNW